MCGREGQVKFVDDLSFLEIIYLLNVGLATYNIHAHVPSNLPVHNQIISSENLKTQEQLNMGEVKRRESPYG